MPSTDAALSRIRERMRERAHVDAQAGAREEKSANDRAACAALDRSILRHWYAVTYPSGERCHVFFCEKRSLHGARLWPGYERCQVSTIEGENL